MGKKILILCCGYPYQTDKRFGYEISKQLETMKLPDNVEFMEVGESACMMPSVIAGADKVIIIDTFQTKDIPGTVVRLKTSEVPITINGLTDIPKHHLIRETLHGLSVTGKCPDIIFIGVVPKDIATATEQLTPEIAEKIPKVLDIILKELSR
jgi:hydrogenase maturation protease